MDEKKWKEFTRRYFKELDNNIRLIDIILDKIKEGSITLLQSAKEERFNNAIALKEYLEKKN